MNKILKNWCVVCGVEDNWRKTPDGYTAPEQITQHLHGNVFNHSGFEDGTLITTSTIKGKRDGKAVTLSGTEYELGEVLTDYELNFKDARNRLFNSLPQV